MSAEANPDSPRLHRREGQNLAALDPVISARRLPIPRLRGTVNLDPWFALVLDDVDGRHPGQPWRAADLGQVLAALDRLAEALTPAPIPVPAIAELYAEDFTGWRTLARSSGRERLDPWSRAHLGELAALESSWAEHAAGDTLLHTDIRADNLLLTADGGVVVVDWPWALVGAPWLDLLLLAASVWLHGGEDAARVVTRHPLLADADRSDVAAVLASFTGLVLTKSREPGPPGLPTIRPWQAAMGGAMLELLKTYVNWE